MKQNNKILNCKTNNSSKVFDETVREADSRDLATLNGHYVKPASAFRTSHKNSIHIDRELVTDAINDKWINTLSFFYFLRFHFTNSRIYKVDKPIDRIALLSGTSKRTVLRRFKALKKQGLLSDDKGSYILQAGPKYRFSKLIYVSENPDITEIKNLLMLHPVRRMAAKQALYKNIRLLVTNETEDYRRNLRKLMVNDTCNSSLSVRYIAKVLKISIGQAHTLKLSLESMGAINTRVQDPEYLGKALVNNMDDYLQGVNYGHRYVQDGKLFEVQPSLMEFCLKPLKVKEITKKVWKKMIKDPDIRAFVNGVYKENARNDRVTKLEQYLVSS